LKLSLAVAGKGGTGKTTLSALLIRALREAEMRPILAVDADPNSNLAEALGVDPGRALAEIREQGSSPEGSPSSGVGRARAIEDEVQRAITEAEGFDLMTMGRGEGPRCYCYVNNLLRTSLSQLSRGYRVVLMDNEAGMEHLSRRTTDNIDFLIAVLDPTMPALRAVKRILSLAEELPIRIGRRMVLLNRAEPSGANDVVLGELEGLPAERLPDVPQDDEVERAGSAGEDVFRLPSDTPALVAVRQVVEALRAAAPAAPAK
jgi:CO dehydrogenase maturation factor